MPAPDLQAVAGRARAAIERRDWAAARRDLEVIVGATRAGAEVHALLGVACQRSGDAPAAHAAADRALQIEPRHLRANLLKAELLDADGAAKEANVYYRGAVDIAAGMASIPPDLAEGVRRADAWRARLIQQMSDRVAADLQRAGYVAGRSDPRFTQAMDVAMGRRRYYPPQPRNFFYPGLPTVQFFPREQLPWFDAVEAATEAMTEELEALLAGQSSFAPYLRTNPKVPNIAGYPLIDSLDWSTAYLVKDGAVTTDASRCPRTMAALADVPQPRIAGRSPTVMFSQLRAGAHIRPHTGAVNTRLICHLPLIVPPDCWFRVGNETRVWERGRGWAFDDTIEHEAMNGSDRTRVVLIFDVWRPELSEEERQLVTALLQAVDAYAPGEAWE